PTVIRGFSDVYGSCITIWMSRRAIRSSRPLSVARLRPLTRISPAVGRSSPSSSLASVDLPHPDSPTTPSVSPRDRVSDTPSTACTAPIRRLITTPRVSGKCLTRSRVRNTTSLIADDLLEEVAGAGPPGGHRTQRGQLGAATVADVPATGRERTARRDAGQVRRESLDHVEFGAL